MALPIRMPHLGPRTRKVLRIVGYFVLFLVTFVFALQWTFPFDRVRDKVVEVLSAKYEVEINGVERGLIPGRVYFKAVTLRTRVAKADDIPTTFFIERLEVNVGILALLGGTAEVGIDAKIGPGNITGTIGLSKSNTSIHLDGAGLPSGMLPMKEAIGLPMSGKVNFNFDLELPNQKLKSGRSGPNWQKAVGGVTFECPSNCTIGDGKTKLKPKLKNNRNQAFAEGGIEFGKLNLSSLLAKVEINKGHLVVKKFDTKSEDGEIKVDFDMTLAQAIDESTVAGCLRFTGSPALMKRDARTHAAISTTGAPLGPDNLYHILLDGKVKEMRRLGKVCGPGGAVGEGSDGTSSRPNLTIQPADAVNPPADAGTPSFTPPALADDAAVTVPVPGPGSEHPNVGSGSAGSGSAAPPPPGAPAVGEPPPPPPSGANPVPEGMR
ncbi:MAG: type II secretion system protein GspN [Myxococcota bacterium]|nr:type II secretion system protein GspN [Myxococcota bacterium]